MMESITTSSQMRPSGIGGNPQQLPPQSSATPQSTPSHPPVSQNFQGHGIIRASSLVSPGSSLANTSQTIQSQNQPWLSSGTQGKPPLPSPAYRPQTSSQSMQQRSHIPQQQLHIMPTASQQQQVSSVQPSPSSQQAEHYGQQFHVSRVPQSLAHQQQISRFHGSGSQKSLPSMMPPSNTILSGSQTRFGIPEAAESGDMILTKRSIRVLVNQIDPSEKLDPEVEDTLLDIANDFVESITTSACSLAKHRKSNTLEAKDILLHLERNWNMTLPGFTGDEIKTYRKPVVNDIHRERLVAIRKQMAGTESPNARSSTGQAAGTAKSHLAKASTSAMDS